MLTIYDTIQGYISRAEAKAGVLRAAYHAVKNPIVGPRPPESDAEAYAEYCRRSRALSAAQRGAIDAVYEPAREAKELAERLRKFFLATIERSYLKQLPQWPVQRTAQERLRVLHTTARRAIERWDGTNNLLLLGPTGCGKTTGAVHVVLAILSKWIDADCPTDQPSPLPHPRKVTGEHALLYEIVAADRFWTQATEIERARRQHALGSGEAPFLRGTQAVDLLVVDDLGQEETRGDTALMDVVNERYNNSKPTIITSGLRPEELTARYGSAFVGRLNQRGGALMGNAFERGNR
jgi:DNA replication protein DnaC